MMKRNSHIAIHNFLLTIKYIALYGTAFTLLYACANTRDDSNLTLADIDIPRSLEKTTQNKPSVLDKRKSQEDIRQAYRTYVENSPSHDNSRQKALTRLAQLELELRIYFI